MEERCGTWRLEQLLAVGGIGEVWRASGIPEGGGRGGGRGDRDDDDRGSTVVAVKRVHSHLIRHDAVLAMFENEQRLLCELPRHPGLLRGVDRSWRDETARPWVATELIEGLDLRRFLDGGAAERGVASTPRVLPPEVALPLVARVCDAVAHLHEQGWVHGDVVPANLLVDDRARNAIGRAVLCDFGVARRASAGGPVQGTHAYMAPEQVRGEAWTPATDVFALGVVLWELLEGKRLFHRGPPWLTMQAILEHEAPPLGAGADRALAEPPAPAPPAASATKPAAPADASRLAAAGSRANRRATTSNEPTTARRDRAGERDRLTTQQAARQAAPRWACP
jgi:serine/threonine-protein kinase